MIAGIDHHGRLVCSVRGCGERTIPHTFNRDVVWCPRCDAKLEKPAHYMLGDVEPESAEAVEMRIWRQRRYAARWSKQEDRGE